MANNRSEFLRLASTKQSTFKVPSLENYEVTLRELTIAESKQFVEIGKDDMEKAVIYACRCSCIAPEFFTDDELKSLGAAGRNAINEIYMEIPLIGKTKEEREEFLKSINENIEKEQKKEVTKEDEKK